ncbi:SNF2-related protein [Kitasatospora sp. NPDC088783]|uniref:SNF2-related protein n=1 Tax=Kitasatospora sp. NPDC088783 TaxID=3364077 RepID=UPI0037F52BAB
MLSQSFLSDLRCSGCGRSYRETGDRELWDGDPRKGPFLCLVCQHSSDATVAAAEVEFLGSSAFAAAASIRGETRLRGPWKSVEVASHTGVDDAPDHHLTVRLRDDRLLIAVARHSDASLVSLFAPGRCTAVARKALSAVGATATGRTVVVQATDELPADTVYLAEDRAVFNDLDASGDLVLLFPQDILPALRDAFAPDIAAQMHVAAGEGPARVVPIADAPLLPAGDGAADDPWASRVEPGSWRQGLLAAVVADDVLPWVRTSGMSRLLATGAEAGLHTDLSRLDARVLASLEKPRPVDLLVVACCSLALPRSLALVWKVLRADLGAAWTALEDVAWVVGMPLVRRSARLGPGLEVCQLALRGSGQGVVGAVAVGDSARSALHRAALTLLEELGKDDPRSAMPHWAGWSEATGLVDWAIEPAVRVAAASGLRGSSRRTGGRLGKKIAAMDREVLRLQQEVDDAKTEKEHNDRQLALVKQIAAEADHLFKAAEEAGNAPPSDEELHAHIVKWTGRPQHHPAERWAGEWTCTRAELASDESGVDGTARQVATADGQTLWVGRIRWAGAAGGEDLVVEGPVQLTEDAALCAAAVVARREAGLPECTTASASLQVWHMLAPQQAWPCVAELVKAGVLPGFTKTVETAGGDGGVVVELAAGSTRGPVGVRAVGHSEEDAVEQAARRLLGALTGEGGFGLLDWSAQHARERLGAFFDEPWLNDRERRLEKTSSRSRRVELSCRIAERSVRVATVSEKEAFADLAANWLLAQEIATTLPAAALEQEPHQALAALHEQGVLTVPVFADGPGGAEAVVVSAACGDRDLWAAGPDRTTAAANLLAAARCHLASPTDAWAAECGLPQPHWLPRQQPPPLQEPGTGEVLLAAVRTGARLCAVGTDDGSEAGFVTVDPGTARKAKRGGEDGAWRVWSERGALAVPGPAVAVADAARHLLAAEPDEGWDISATAWRAVLRFGCQTVAQGQVRPGLRADGRALWRLGTLGDEQHARFEQLTTALPPWAHSQVLPGRREAMPTAPAAAALVLGELADALVRGPGAAAVWGASPLTARTAQPVSGAVARWLDEVEEIADTTPAPDLVLQVMPPSRRQATASSLQVTVRLRPSGRDKALVALPDLRERLGAEHPAVLRALRALRKAARLWPVLAGAEDQDRVRVEPGQAALLLGHLGRVLRRAGVEVLWPEQWAQRLRPTVVASTPAGGGLSLEQLVDYRWQVRLDGSALSAQECERIAEAAGTLMWLRNRWVLVDQATAERARGGRVRGGVPAGEALSAVLVGTVELDDGESADLVADGDLATLAAVLTGTAHTPVPQPEGLAGTLWPYQAVGLSWLANVTRHFGALLCDEMGLGKTIQTIALILHRAETGLSQGLPTLVVAPASMVLTWVRRVQEFAPTLPVRAYHGSDRTLEHLGADEVVVTSYATLLEDRTAMAAQRYSLLVADEAQFIKNATTQRTKAIAAIQALARIALTGTPVENRLRDLGTLLNFSNQHLFDLKTFTTAFGSLDRAPDPHKQAALNRVTGAVMLRRRKDDPAVALDLPDKITTVRTLALTDAQSGLYTRTTRIAMEAIRSTAPRERKGAVLRLITQLRQICNSPLHQRIGSADSGRLEALLAGYDPDRESRQSSKLAALDDLVPSILDDGPESAVIFTEFATMAMLLRRHATAVWGLRPLLYVGSMTASARDAALSAFRRRRNRLLIVTYGSGGTGLDLVEASHAILVDRPFNPALAAQAVDRLHRPGQRRTVHIHPLQTVGTIEEKIEALLTRKSALLDALDPQTSFDPAQLSNDELHELVSLGALV